MKTIVINNPAARESGALTILEQFLIKIYNSNKKRIFFCFVSVEELKKYEKENIKIIVLPKQSFKDRILWDNFGLKKYLKNRKIIPDLFISIQNTGVNLDPSIPQILYFHQALSLVDKNWNYFNQYERPYWFYRNIYPFFIKQYLKKIKKVIVQTNWVKEEFSKKFSYPLGDIFVKKPNISLPKIEEVAIIEKEKFRIFYPAMPYIYKNHNLIIKSLKKLNKQIIGLENKIECIFTFSEKDNSYLSQKIKDSKLEKIIKLVGVIPYQKVLEYYKNSDLLVYPSYIETLGLPLIEAKHFDLDILAIDLQYSREALGDYKKVEYFKEEKFKNKLEYFILKI